MSDQNSPVILLAFDAELDPIEQKEAEHWISLLEVGHRNGSYQIVIHRDATLESIFTLANEHREHLILLHLSGGFGLQEKGGNEPATISRSQLAKRFPTLFEGLQKFPELQLIASDTLHLSPFGSYLRGRELSCLLAPRRPVSSEHRLEFFVQFYELLVEGNELQESFEKAISYVEVLYPPESDNDSSTMRVQIENLIVEDKLEGAFDLLQGLVREARQKDLEVAVQLQYRRLSNLEKKIKGGNISVEEVEKERDEIRRELLGRLEHYGLEEDTIQSKEDEDNLAYWELFVPKGREENLKWILPNIVSEDRSGKKTDSFQPNSLLLSTLIDELQIATLDPDIGLVLDKEQEEPVSDRKKQTFLLNSFPYPIADPLQKLFNPSRQKGGEDLRVVGEARLNHLVESFRTSMELYLLILCAQLWEEFRKGQSEFRPDPDSPLTQLFENRFNIEAYEFLPMLEVLRAVMEPIPPALRNAYSILSDLSTNSPVRQACKGIVDIKQALIEKEISKAGYITDEALERYCQEAEQSLTTLLRELMFLVRYALTSVDRILVQQHYLMGKPQYLHEVKYWENLLGGIEMDTLTKPDFLASQTISLLNKEEDMAFALNLSPFLIDIAHWDKERDSQLFVLSHHYQGQIFYKNSSRTEDTLTITEASHPELYAQMESFYQEVFGRALYEAPRKK